MPDPDLPVTSAALHRCDSCRKAWSRDSDAADWWVCDSDPGSLILGALR
jgi:hypothetical protein